MVAEMNKMKEQRASARVVTNFILQQYEDEGRDPIERGRIGNDYDENNKRTIYMMNQQQQRGCACWPQKTY